MLIALVMGITIFLFSVKRIPKLEVYNLHFTFVFCVLLDLAGVLCLYCSSLTPRFTILPHQFIFFLWCIFFCQVMPDAAPYLAIAAVRRTVLFVFTNSDIK